MTLRSLTKYKNALCVSWVPQVHMHPCLAPALTSIYNSHSTARDTYLILPVIPELRSIFVLLAMGWPAQILIAAWVGIR